MSRVANSLFQIIAHSHWVALPATEKKLCGEEKVDSGDSEDLGVSAFSVLFLFC